MNGFDLNGCQLDGSLKKKSIAAAPCADRDDGQSPVLDRYRAIRM